MPNTKKKHATILVTGSDGFVGSQLCRELLQRGYAVLGTRWTGAEGHAETGKETYQQRTNGEETHHLHTISIRDIGPETDWASALVGIDAVVHLAARVHMIHDKAADPLAEFRRINVEGTRRLADAAAQAGIKRFVFLSSVKVNGAMTEKDEGPFTETDPPQPEDAYGLSKWEAEQVLREIEQRTGIEVVIIRPPLIYGPTVKANFLNLIQLIERGIPLPLGGIRNQRSFLSLTNLVALLCCCLEHSAAAGETFLVSDGDDVSTPELVRRIATALGKPARLLSVPEWLMRLGGTVTGKSEQVKRLCGSLQIDSSKVRRMLGWAPPASMAEELALVAAWRAARLHLAENAFASFANESDSQSL